METKRVNHKRNGFTIIELLTVMGVIAILIGLLVPALNLVHDFAAEIQQKAQFHSLEVAIEMFNTEYGYYPPSSDNQFAYSGNYSNTPYSGAHKLAEALIGWDLVGFHPRSDFRAEGTFSHDDGSGTMINGAPAYHLTTDYAPTNTKFAETREENMKARTPFMDLENANAFMMEDVYQTYGSYLADNFLICDEYSRKRYSGEKTGMPVLYWKADTSKTVQDSLADADSSSSNTDDDIYRYDDNDGILALLTEEQDGTVERMDTPAEFDDFINNENIGEVYGTTINRPYRASSYILISAGKDGYYGTADDITNFSRTEE